MKAISRQEFDNMSDRLRQIFPEMDIQEDYHDGIIIYTKMYIEDFPISQEEDDGS